MKVAIISGASRGIGGASAQRFVDDGWAVYNVARNPSESEKITDVYCDLTDQHSVEAIEPALLGAVREAKRVCLVHNASAAPFDMTQDVDAKTLRDVLEIGLVAPSQINRWLIPAMPQGSSILYVGSTLSEQAVANRASYVTVKHAVVGMMRATCQDLADLAIHTACVCPGFTDTEMVRPFMKKPEVRQKIQDVVCAGRLLEPQELAELIFFCANNASINGAVLHANLGQRGA